MSRPEPTPRVCRYMGMTHAALELGQGTWMEAEAFCYPGGGMNRRACALCPDGKLRVFRCGIPDTFFSTPVKGGGWIGTKDDALVYHPPKNRAV